MVFLDDVTVTTPLPVPPDKESESIGVEGLILKVDNVTDLKKGDTEQHLKIKSFSNRLRSQLRITVDG